MFLCTIKRTHLIAVRVCPRPKIKNQAFLTLNKYLCHKNWKTKPRSKGEFERMFEALLFGHCLLSILHDLPHVLLNNSLRALISFTECMICLPRLPLRTVSSKNGSDGRFGNTKPLYNILQYFIPCCLWPVGSLLCNKVQRVYLRNPNKLLFWCRAPHTCHGYLFEVKSV